MKTVVDLVSKDERTTCHFEVDREGLAYDEVFNELYRMARDTMLYCIRNGCTLHETEGVLKTLEKKTICDECDGCSLPARICANEGTPVAKLPCDRACNAARFLLEMGRGGPIIRAISQGQTITQRKVKR